MKITCFILLAHAMTMTHFIHAQKDKSKTTESQKTGYCKVYLDEKAMPVDSNHACFFGYEFYDGGKKTFEVFPKSNPTQKYVFEGEIPPKGKPVAIDGTLKVYQIKEGKKDLILIQNTYKNGYPQLYTEYYMAGEGDIWHTFDFTRQFENIPGTFLITDYVTYEVMANDKRKTTRYWYRKEGSKWKGVKIDD